MDITDTSRLKFSAGMRAVAVCQLAWPRFLDVTAGRALARWLVGSAVGATLLATALIISLHLLPGAGGVNPLHGMLSDYALQPDGWAFRLALLIIGAASAALSVVLLRHRVLWGWIAVIFMAMWCVGVVGIATFSKDRFETNQTIHGGVHLWFTASACAALPVLGLMLGLRHRRHQYWRGYARSSLYLALANVPCLLPFVVAFTLNVVTHSERFSGPATGLIERIMAGLDIASLIAFALWAFAAAHQRHSSTVDAPSGETTIATFEPVEALCCAGPTQRRRSARTM